MRVTVIGDGKVGHMLAEQLIAEGHDITIIDRNEMVLQRSIDTLDALVIKGSGVSVDTLTEADAQHTDIVIAATISDEINMLSCLTAKRIGAKYAIARIRDPEYMGSLNFLQKELSIDYVINPERNTAREISRMLRYPFAGAVETFARGRVELIDFRATREDPVVGIPLRDLYKTHHNLPQVLFCAVERGHEAIIPKGDFIINPGDRVFVASDVSTITAFFRAIGKNISRVHRVMIMGGSRIAYYLSLILLDMGTKVSIIEINDEKARMLSEMLPNANIILGDGTDQELLQSEGLSESDAFIALSDRDEENLMTGLYAVKQGIDKVIVKNNRPKYTELMSSFGLDSIISPKQVTANTILRTVRARANADGTAVERLYRLMDGRAEALEFIVHAGDTYTNVPLKDLVIRENALVAVIVREGQVHIPFGNDILKAGDHVVIIAKDQGVKDLHEVLKREKI